MDSSPLCHHLEAVKSPVICHRLVEHPVFGQPLTTPVISQPLCLRASIKARNTVDTIPTSCSFLFKSLTSLRLFLCEHQTRKRGLFIGALCLATYNKNKAQSMQYKNFRLFILLSCCLTGLTAKVKVYHTIIRISWYK